jgi:glucuronate isomerase
MSAASALALHPDRLLPADPGTRAVARRLYQAVRDLPILSPHGHIDAATLLDDEPLQDPTALFITPDHYVTRLPHASGVALDELGVGQGRLDEPAAHPAVFAGAPWWFIDAPDAITRYRAAVTETAGFSRTSGFIDDTRALCSIPARHDMSRRLDSGYLARLVAEHRLDEDEALETVVELVTGNPRRVFKL